MLERFKAWCASDTAAAKCTRTIAQGIVGALIAYLPDIITGGEVIPAQYKALVVAIAMAVLSPIQASIGTPLDGNGTALDGNGTNGDNQGQISGDADYGRDMEPAEFADCIEDTEVG